MSRNAIFFASDFHLGAPNHATSLEREKKIVRWLDSIKHEAKAIYLMGDLFDFWHEFDTVVPKGFVRFLGKLAELSDAGIAINIFIGNHDIWMKNYFPKELNATVHKKELRIELFGNKVFLHHGDGLGPGDPVYKVLKKMFHNGLFKFIFKWAHPDIGMRIAHFWSSKSRSTSQEEEFLGEENEWLVTYSKEILENEDVDFFIFGHRHLPLDIRLNEKGSRYINLGEWFSQCNYAKLDANGLQLLHFED